MSGVRGCMGLLFVIGRVFESESRGFLISQARHDALPRDATPVDRPFCGRAATCALRCRASQQAVTHRRLSGSPALRLKNSPDHKQQHSLHRKRHGQLRPGPRPRLANPVAPRRSRGGLHHRRRRKGRGRRLEASVGPGGVVRAVYGEVSVDESGNRRAGEPGSRGAGEPGIFDFTSSSRCSAS